MADGNAEILTDDSFDSSSSDGDREHWSEVQPMTQKGIRRLCSELLEVKKVSEEDFSQNAYSCYSAFVRILDEVPQVNYDLEELKEHVSNQRNLVQNLFKCLYLDKLSDNTIETNKQDEDLDLYSSTKFDFQVYDTLDALDIFLSEQKVNDALILLEKTTKTLHNMKMEEHIFPSMTSYFNAISDWRTRLAKQFIALAKHPRVTHTELQKALSGLLRLGEGYQANILLLKFYHLRLEHRLQELFSQKESLGHFYPYEVAKAVFSIIFQAAKSSIFLNGETYPCSLELLDWARTELEEFSHIVYAYFISKSEIIVKFHQAVEVVHYAISLCSLLSSQRLFLVHDLMNYLRPCMEDLLDKHLDHYRDVSRILVENETWVLKKFLLSELIEETPSTAENGAEEEYCLLTCSGRKFVPLIQDIVNDFSSMVTFEMGCSIAQGLAGLINEYIISLEQAIQSKETSLGIFYQGIMETSKLEQQLLLLVNTATIVKLLPIITSGIFGITKPPHSHSDQVNRSSQELYNLVLSVEEAADRLQSTFCHQFVNASVPILESNAKYAYQSTAGSKQEIMFPSFIFQELFYWLRKLENISRSIFEGKHGIVKLLIKLMEALPTCLSSNQSLWKITEDSSKIRMYNFLEQVHMDIYFLLEIAKNGGYLSDNLLATTMNTLKEIDVTYTSFWDLDGVLPDDSWVQEIASLAIEKLKKLEPVESQLKAEPPRSQRMEAPVLVDVRRTSVDSASSVHIEPESKSHISGMIRFVKVIERQNAVASFIEDDKVCKSEGETDIRGPQGGSDEDVSSIDVLAQKQQDATKENFAGDAKFLQVSTREGEGEVEAKLEKNHSRLPTGIISSPIVEADYVSCSSSEGLSDAEEPIEYEKNSKKEKSTDVKVIDRYRRV
ncbi:exocyst complex component EXO84A-like [Zingiber officinale]|uniref:exocyst complex component EXO84A-like n=1 Tax=Zingiber officinale TaxID=94328 RepID=UPI001C4C7305|nr:exocyst complex component EXO84A-like [Zingiber officinale]